MEESARVSRCTLSDLEYSEVPLLFTGAQEELLNTPKPGSFGLSL
jgi:hypothetical protein